MSDEKTAETLASEVELPVNDGIVDLDAAEQVEAKDEKPEPKADAEVKGDEAKPEDEKKKLSGAQRAKIREARLLSELSARDRELDELRRSAPAAKASESDEKPPREEDFNGDYFAFQRALTAFDAGKATSAAIEKQFKTREDSERSTKQAEIARERDVSHAERVEDVREAITDFDAVMATMKGVQVRQDVIDEIKSSEKGPLIQYHLALNPDKLLAMNSMSARELAREMGRLEATVELPSAKKATTAPAPLSSLKGGASPSSAEGDLQAWLKKTYGR